ncbi:MAG: adenylate/guanylate cyclase domain-containing protein [Bacteroidia bacterium]
MLRYFYQVVNKAIINNDGEIYQYRGDEIVVSWDMENGLKNNNCLDCFYGIRKTIITHTPEFKNQFGAVPDFKAAIHSGNVITGEIGLIKKDIVYSGDVLNTTERMFSLCRRYDQDLIISERIHNNLYNISKYHFVFLGEPVLKGKSVKAKL